MSASAWQRHCLTAAYGGDSDEPPEADRGSSLSPATTITPAAGTASPSPVGAIVLAAGELELPSVTSQQEAAYHQVLTATHVLPSDQGPTAGFMLVVKLWDAGRQEITCDSDHPISGCAGASLTLRLVMTKFRAPDVRIGYEITLEPAT